MKRLRGFSQLSYGLLLLMIGLSLLLVMSCEESTGPGDTGTSSTYRIMLSSASQSISSNGGSTQITAKVYTDNDTTKVQSGVTVTFAANQAGTTVSMNVDNAITDASGKARATVYGGVNPGTISVMATIQVSAKEQVSDTIFITVTPGAGLVSASPNEILADGISQSVITAVVVDSLGVPVSGSPVSFTTTYGVITAQSYSDDTGLATATLRSAASSTDISVTVTATSNGTSKIAALNVDGNAVAKTSELSENDEKNAEKDDTAGEVSKPAAVEGTLGSVTVLFKGITISATLGTEIVFANDADSTMVQVNVKETTSGAAVEDKVVKLSASIGRLRAAEGVTDSLGNIEVVLLGGTVAGDGTFTALISEGLSVSVEYQLVKEINLKLTSNPSVLSANGTDLSNISALITDVDGNPVDSVMVYFRTTDGVIQRSAMTDEWGIATVQLRAARYNAIAQVTAQYGLIERKTDVQFGGTVLSILGTPLILVADNTSTAKLSITLTDASSAPIVDENVTVSTTIGTLYSGDNVAMGSSFIDSTSTEGKITAYISSDEAGTALITVSGKGSTDSLTINFTNYIFTLTPLVEEILAGGQKTSVTARLEDIENNLIPISLENISFSTTRGTIGNVTRNDNGTVKAELFSGNSAGTATISASISDPEVTATTEIKYVAADVDSIYLKSDKPTVAIGGSAVSIIAIVYDETGNPKESETVTFSLLGGPGSGEEIQPGTAVTDEQGRAEVEFVTGSGGSERDGVSIQAKIGEVESNVITLTISGEPKSIKVGYDPSTFTENLNGTYSVEVSAIVADVNRNQVVDGTIVNFALEGDAGVIEGQVPTVDGIANTQLTYSPSDAGKTVTLTSSAGGEKDEITFPLPGFEPAYFVLTAVPSIIPADGKSESAISCTLFDQNGSSENVPDGTIVAFSTEGGSIDPVATTVDGVATAYLRSDKEPAEVKVTAKSGDYEDVVYLEFEEIGLTVNEVRAIDLTVDDSELKADGISSTYVRALLLTTDGNVIHKSTTVEFETSLGEITSSVLSDSATGYAVAQFTSSDVGTAKIRASVGEIYEYINVFLVPGDPLSVELEFDPVSVGIQGSGRNVTLQVTANVKDENNNTVQDSTLVRFELIGVVDPDASLSPESTSSQYISDAIPTVNGSASVSFSAGTIAGTVRIRATVVDENGNDTGITSETTEFQVFSGPPYLDMNNPADPFTESRVTLAGSPLNIYAGELNTENSVSTITVIEGDKYKNPVPAGTAAYFTTTGGIITTQTGYTDSSGLASVKLFAGNPFPTRVNSQYITNPNSGYGGPSQFDIIAELTSRGYGDFDGDGLYNDGIAIVTATSRGVDHLERQVDVWNYVPIVFSKDVYIFTVTSNTYSLDVGETATITVRIYDINGNPVVGGSLINYSSKLGSLSHNQEETNTPGTTTYYVTLTNDLDPDVDTPGTTVVNVSLESANGNIVKLLDQPIQMTINVP